MTRYDILVRAYVTLTLAISMAAAATGAHW
jgi:hypothetical protein